MENNARIFDAHAPTYNRVRPGYPKEVYDLVTEYKALGGSSHILEIGAGQGIATEEIARYWHPVIDAIEPGTNLVKILQTRTAAYDNIRIYASEFEDYQSGGKRYDAIFSATAFHWTDKDIKYTKSHELLKPDGLLIVYWNNYGIQDHDIERTIRDVYREYGFVRNDSKTAAEYTKDKIKKRQQEICESGLFEIVRHEEIVQHIAYTREQYIGLLRTFSDHTPENIPDIECMFSAIHEAIGDTITVKILVNVEIAKKISSS